MPSYFNPLNWYWVVGDHTQLNPQLKSRGTEITVPATNQKMVIPEPPQWDEIVDTEVYSSERNIYVPSDDAIYLAWIDDMEAQGVYRPTSRIDTEANLKEVLQIYARAPVNTKEPEVSWKTQNQMLQCTAGEWTGEPDTYSFVWQMDGVTVPIDSGATYTITADDVGKIAMCIVTATNDIGSTQAPASNRLAIPEPKTS